jgi:hypothetical protein
VNSIRRPRKRPRVESVSLDSFAWVLVREVALRVLCRDPRALAPQSWERCSLCSVPTSTLQSRVRRRLNWRGGLVV